MKSNRMSVGNAEELRGILSRIDGRGYRAYQELRGSYSLGRFALEIAHVQGDPYAPPSRLHVRIPPAQAGFATAAQESPARRLGFEDYLGRALAGAIERASAHELGVDAHGQEMLRRTAVRIRPGTLEARLSVELPAAGRRIRGRASARILCDQLPIVLAAALRSEALGAAALRRHQDTAEDHHALRACLQREGWVAFIADGAILPRRAGHDDRPLTAAGRTPVVPLRAPPELAAEVRLPHVGRVRGLAIPRGVTLLVGGGFHGKSTLLDAIARGIYPHVPGDGREQVASDPATVKIRAEDGRAVTGTDIRVFIGELPFGRATDAFTTQNASGSTSQAANIIEALEAGARVLLLDEDTSATNFMIRDEPMRRLLRPGQEPITPLLDRVADLYRERGVSTVLVVGGSGEYFRVADRVIQMDQYVPYEVTARAREIVGAMSAAGHGSVSAPPAGSAAAAMPGSESRGGDGSGFAPPAAARRLSLEAYRQRIGPKGPRVKAQGIHRILAEREEIDLVACEQLVSGSQTRTLAQILERLLEGESRDPAWRARANGFTPEEIQHTLDACGEDLLDRASRFPRGDLALVRGYEVVAMLNRLRKLSVSREQLREQRTGVES